MDLPKKNKNGFFKYMLSKNQMILVHSQFHGFFLNIFHTIKILLEEWEIAGKNFREIDLSHFTSFMAWTFYNLMSLYEFGIIT